MTLQEPVFFYEESAEPEDEEYRVDDAIDAGQTDNESDSDDEISTKEDEDEECTQECEILQSVSLFLLSPSLPHLIRSLFPFLFSLSYPFPSLLFSLPFSTPLPSSLSSSLFLSI